jgi:hypothetical protein
MTKIAISDELSEEGKKMMTMIKKFQVIEQKNRCVRVRFLDWLSAKLMVWSRKVKAASDRIDSPCVIKLGPKEEKPAKKNPNVHQLW